MRSITEIPGSLEIANRELYAPGHFGNSYEVASEFEIVEFLNDSKHWGFTAYSEWFDTAGLISPWSEKQNCEYSSLLWNKKIFSLKTSNKLGLKTGLSTTPNHVFANQLKPENAVNANHPRIMGQLVCPSTEAGHDIILQNYSNIFRDLYQHDVRLDSIKFGPYDYGGCGCSNCNPWIVAFIKLSIDIYKIAQTFFPEIEFDLVGWWWSDKEHKLLREWINRRHDLDISSIALHIRYNKYIPEEVETLSGCKKRAFVHIGYGNTRQEDGIQDIYGLWGPVSACRRLSNTLKMLKLYNYNGYMAYAEGAYHDLNNVVLASLSSGKATTARESLQEYANYYFNCLPTASRNWAHWVLEYEDFELPKIEKAQKDFVLIQKDMPKDNYNWRLEHWKSKLELLRLHNEISKIAGWPEQKINLVDKWRRTSASLRRNIYGLGIVKHVFQEHYCGAPWYNEWEHLTGRKYHESLCIEY